ncbi:MAG: hypothetical protein ABIH41_02230, partial [Nanoarchaeota archaeon]
LAISREVYPQLVGLKQEIDTKKVVERFADLFCEDTLAIIVKERETEQDPLRRRRLNMMYFSIHAGIMERKVVHLSDRAENFASKASVRFEGKRVPYMNVPNVMMNLPSHAKRSKLTAATVPIRRKLLAMTEEQMKRIDAMIEEKGFDNYFVYCQTAKDTDLLALADQLREVLVDTKNEYRKSLYARLKRINVSPKVARQHDVSFMMRGHDFDSYFPKEKLVPTLKSTLAGMGFHIDRQKNIRLDVSDRPNKRARAFCYPIKVPSDVRLVVKPSGGPGDYDTILHESGHAEHYANMPAGLRYEFQYLGDNAITESFAYLFEYLIHDEHWLSWAVGLEGKQADELVRFELFQKLMFIRRYAAKLIYEIKLYTKDLRVLDDRFEPTQKMYASRAQMYQRILGEATMVKYDQVNYLLDLDSGFYAADYCLAWLLEAQHRANLRKRFGAMWWTNPKTGVFLRRMYATGTTYTPQELVRRFYKQPISITYLEKDFVSI